MTIVAGPHSKYPADSLLNILYSQWILMLQRFPFVISKQKPEGRRRKSESQASASHANPLVTHISRSSLILDENIWLRWKMLWFLTFRHSLTWNTGSDGSTKCNKYVTTDLERTWKCYLPSMSLASPPAFRFLKIFKEGLLLFFMT